MTDLVIDASVAIKWVIEEHGTREAMSLRRHRLFAPELLVAEMRKCAVEENTAAGAHLGRGAARCQTASARRCRAGPDASLARAGNRTCDLDGPSCLRLYYLALAESLSCDLVTADVKLSAKPLPLGYKSKVLGLTMSALP